MQAISIVQRLAVRFRATAPDIHGPDRRLADEMASDPTVSALQPTSTQAHRVTTLFTDQGFVLLPSAIPQNLCRRFSAEIQKAYTDETRNKSELRGILRRRHGSLGGSLHGHLNCFPGSSAKRICDLIDAAGIIKMMETFLNCELQLVSVGCNINLPGSHAQNFHIDGSWDEPFVIVNVSLVDTVRSNGATVVVKGTHGRKIKFWKFVTSGLWLRGQAIETSAGDVVIRMSSLWHRGMPNHTAEIRPMLGLVYSRHAVGRADFNWNDSPQDIKFISNRYDSSLRGHLAEGIATYTPWAAFFVRLVKSFLTE